MIDKMFSVPKFEMSLYSNERINGMLDKSVKQHRATYVQGITGCGKTCFISKWVRERKLKALYEVFWLDCKKISNELLSKLEQAIEITTDPVLLVLDHYEEVAFGEWEERVAQLYMGMEVNDRYILITKGIIPDALVSEIATQRANLVSALDLMLTNQEVKQYINHFKKCDINLDEFSMRDDLPPFIIALNLLIVQYEKFNRPYPEIFSYMESDLYRYYTCEVLNKWSEEELDIICRLHPYAVITKDLICRLYGDESKYKVLEAFSRKNCFLQRHNVDEFVFVKKFKVYIERSLANNMDRDKYCEIVQDAITYYEERKDYQYVTKLYLDLKVYDKALESFIKCHKYPGNKHFKPNYLQYIKQFPDEVIEKNPEAVFWMALNSLVMMDLNVFLKWSSVFMDTYDTSQTTSKRWENMDQQYVYLKLVSPLSKLKDVLELVKQSHGHFTMGEFIKELFSYVALDYATILLFRHWDLADGLEEFRDNAMAEEFLGERVYALLTVYLGIRYFQSYRMEEATECLYKGTIDCRELGMYGPGLCGELCLLDVQRENKGIDYDVLGKKEEVLKWAMSKEAYIKHYDSYYIRIWLQQHNIDKINEWIAQLGRTLNGSHNLITFKNYMQQVRVLILIENLYEAQSRLDALIVSLNDFRFHGDTMECLILYAIICYRRNLEDKAVQYFLKAYWLAKKHGFAIMISGEGVAVQPILFSVAKRLPSIAMEPEFQTILKHTNVCAKRYPKYLLPKTKEKDILTRTEIEILVELDSGNTLSEIARQRCISLNTIKQHTKSIYGKLKVNKRNMAIRVAKERGLI